jgi:prepilin-type N-terminal cleavage/methylation domain-containing protein
MSTHLYRDADSLLIMINHYFKMDFKTKQSEIGFTLLEMMTVLGIISLLAVIATPIALSWMPRYRLKNAALDLFSNFQLARMRAIQCCGEYAIIFNGRTGNYQLVNGGANKKFEGGIPASDDIVEKTVVISEYGCGVRYGFGCAVKKATVGGGSFQAGDEISYRDDIAEFNSQGMSNRMGYVYLENNQKSSYAISTATLAGVVSIKQWTGERWQ